MFSKLFLIFLLSSSIFNTHSYNTQCLDHQEHLLLQLKNEFIFDSSLSTKLVQWNQTNNCCHWHGVECNGAGHVVSLQLDDEYISSGIGDSSALFRLKYLEKLNLAYNDFNALLIPKGIQNLKYLTHLNLSNAGFSGQVPIEISSFRRLISLDISGNETWNVKPSILKYPNLEMLLRNLTGLRELYLDRVDITSSRERTKWSHIISSYLPNLTTLSLRYCYLYGPLATSFWKLHSLSVLRLDENDLSTANLNLFTNFSFLTTLSLRGCSLKGSFPSIIFQIPTLKHLHLYENQQLHGSLPPFPQFGSLESIRLSGTNFSGMIPSSISNLKSLSEIDLSDCRFRGQIPSTFANLTRLTSVNLYNNFFTGSLSPTMFEGFSSLVNLHLGLNSFTGNIPKSLFGLPSLQRLDLSGNNFTGVIGEFPTVNLSKILYLRLSGNRIEGPIPDSFFRLRSLEYVFLEGNSLNGSFQLDKIQSMANLTKLVLSGNNLSVHVNNDNSATSGLPYLTDLSLSSCNMYNFPDLIKYSNQMETLDLSNNRIGGEIPGWIWGEQLMSLDLSFNLLTHLQKPYHIPPSLWFLDLQSNQLTEELHLLFPPNITYTLQYLLLSNNSLSGSIPTSICTSTLLEAIDLSTNKLRGTIPSCLLDGTLTNLYVLDLGQNNITGHIPDDFPPGCWLNYLDLSNNILEGKIPKSIERCKWLELINVGNNLLIDTFPCMLSSSLSVLVLHSNKFHGEVKCSNDWWPMLQIMDISSNNFSGNLESTNFSSWRGMVLPSSAQFGRTKLGDSFNLAQLPTIGVRITMKGLEVELVKIYSDFTIIDFSRNNFHGEIPKAIGDLSSLRLLNFSHNSINGSIPRSFGKLVVLESLDLSQNQLTGHIPTELSRLTFLSVLNVSYNKLIGEIPKGRQIQTFSADSFLGNPGLCGFNLNISCINRTVDDGNEKEKKKKKREIEWEYVSVALGYVVGLGSFLWLLLFSRRFRYKYFGKIDEVVEEMLDARERRRRRRAHARRVERNRARRQ